MPTRNVNLTAELDNFVVAKVASGRAALRTLEQTEREYEARLAVLQAAIDEGDSSGLPMETLLAAFGKS